LFDKIVLKSSTPIGTAENCILYGSTFFRTIQVIIFSVACTFHLHQLEGKKVHAHFSMAAILFSNSSFFLLLERETHEQIDRFFLSNFYICIVVKACRLKPGLHRLLDGQKSWQFCSRQVHLK
jgi:hypothetical protein